MDPANWLFILCVVGVMVCPQLILAGNEQHSKVLSLQDVMALTEEHTVPYIAMKMKREKLANDSANQMFGSIAALYAPMAQIEKKISKGLKIANFRKDQLFGMFKGINNQLTSSLGSLSDVKSKCPNNVAFIGEPEPKPLQLDDDMLEMDNDQEEPDTHQPAQIDEVSYENFLTTGATSRMAAIHAKLGHNSIMTLHDAMQVFSAAAQMCDSYAAKRLALYLNKARAATARLHVLQQRLTHIAEKSEQIMDSMTSFDKKQAFDLLHHVNTIESTVGTMDCA